MSNIPTIDLPQVARQVKLAPDRVEAVVALLDAGNTVPFITRYRRDQTGGLDEEQIRAVQATVVRERLLAERKQTILRSIDSQGKLTPEFAASIAAATCTKQLEDLYLPFKPKKQTLATAARARGLEPLSREILAADPACADLERRAADFINPDRGVPGAAEALLGAGHLLAEWFSEGADLRHRLRKIFARSGRLVTSGEAPPPESSEPKTESKSAAAAAGTPPQATTDAEAGTPPDTPPGEVQPPADESTATESISAETTASESTTAESAVSEPTVADTTAIPINSAESASEEPGTVVEPAAVESTPASPGTVNAETADAATIDAATMASAGDADPASDGPESVASSESAGSEHAVESASQPAVPPAAASDQPETPPVATSPPDAAAPSDVATPPDQAAVSLPAAPPKSAKKKRSKKTKRDTKLDHAFRDYFDYSEAIGKVPPHRVLAINRGERAKVLRVKIEVDMPALQAAVDEAVVPEGHPHADFLRGCGRDALARLILPSLEREFRRELTDRAETHAVEVFARNLRNLLLQPPVRNRRVLAVDPGFRHGCKLVALDEFGNPLGHRVVYLVGSGQRREAADKQLVEMVSEYHPSVMAIGNGTGCREAEGWISDLIAGGALADHDVAFVVVNEAGASVYSTSQLGRAELPGYDATLRGAISIGRRIQDPLSELVKIDPANIGVGMYQHDVKAKHLRTSLDAVVESCVNYVGVDVNSASPALLKYVSGLNQLTAQRLYEHRTTNGPLTNREQLRDVPGLGEASFVQAAGFLKIAGGDNPLDATWIHPESYTVAEQVLAKLGYTPGDLTDKARTEQIARDTAAVDREKLAAELGTGVLTLGDILDQLVRPGRDPRESLPPPLFKRGVLKLEDLTPGMQLTGSVLNVVDFGAFVDIGVRDCGLVHISRLADKFVKSPHEVVSVGDTVTVWVVEIDGKRRRVSLTMIDPSLPPRETPKPPPKESRRDSRRDSRKESHRKRPPARSGGPGARGGKPRQRTAQQTATREAKPRPAPPPVKLTKAKIAGKKPLQTFGELAAFLKQQSEEETDSGEGAK